MKAVHYGAIAFCVASAVCWAARCTTVVASTVLHEYENYVSTTESTMDRRFDSGELTWAPRQEARQASAKLDSGVLVRYNISDGALNERLAGQNGTVIHWVGALRIPNATVAEVQNVLEDYDRYAHIYQPMVTQCKAVADRSAAHPAWDLTMNLHSTFRVVSVFPQHYAFQMKGRINFSGGVGEAPTLGAHLKAIEIRESDSGIPGRNDFLEPYHDHGILWALNAYWRVRQQGSGVYLEFETITLARSVQEFACRIGFVPVPKTIVASAMDSLPADCLTVILEGTRAECGRRSIRGASSQ